MIVVEPGTKDKDTICKCIDGYELPKDEFGLTDNLTNKCVKIKGTQNKNYFDFFSIWVYCRLMADLLNTDDLGKNILSLKKNEFSEFCNPPLS